MNEEALRRIAEFCRIEIGEYTSHPDEFNTTFHISDVAYGTDWNWLMAAVEAIERLPEDGLHPVVEIGCSTCVISTMNGELHCEVEANDKRAAVFEAVDNFIQQYNSWKETN